MAGPVVLVVAEVLVLVVSIDVNFDYLHTFRRVRRYCDSRFYFVDL